MIIEVIIGVIIVVMWTKFLNVNEAVKLKHILLLLSKYYVFIEYIVIKMNKFTKKLVLFICCYSYIISTTNVIVKLFPIVISYYFIFIEYEVLVHTNYEQLYK